jgi:hypothetical protein
MSRIIFLLYLLESKLYQLSCSINPNVLVSQKPYWSGTFLLLTKINFDKSRTGFSIPLAHGIAPLAEDDDNPSVAEVFLES